MGAKVHLIADGRVQPLKADQQRLIDFIAEIAGHGVPRLQTMCEQLGWDFGRGERVLAELEELGLAKLLHIEVGTRRLARYCTRCLAQVGKVQARYVATGVSGMQWFECGDHDPTDNELQERRETLQDIAEWFSANGLELPMEP